jgi:enoyl-CoA hydratase
MKDQASDELLYEVKDTTGVITLNRPSAHNALTFEMYDKIAEICGGVRVDGPVKAIIVT